MLNPSRYMTGKRRSMMTRSDVLTMDTPSPLVNLFIPALHENGNTKGLGSSRRPYSTTLNPGVTVSQNQRMQINTVAHISVCCSDTVDDDDDTVIGSDGPRRTRSRVCGVPILASTDTGTTKVLVSDGTRSGTWKAHQETARPLPWYPADFEVAIGNLTRPLLVASRRSRSMWGRCSRTRLFRLADTLAAGTPWTPTSPRSKDLDDATAVRSATIRGGITMQLRNFESARRRIERQRLTGGP